MAWCSGRINKTHTTTYVGGQISSFTNIDVNEWRLFTLGDKVKELGYDMIDSMKINVDLDDIDFEQFVDPNVEFGGLDDDGTGLTMEGDENLRINFSDEGSDKDSDKEE
nr:uncharacterized protein LOC109154045 [Ipomoea batatas]